MWLGFILVFLVALVFFWLAISISKGKINLIHNYHRINVKEEDKKDYCKLFSRGLYIIGSGCLLSSFFIFLENGFGVIISIVLGIVVGIIFINKAQNRYNS